MYLQTVWSWLQLLDEGVLSEGNLEEPIFCKLLSSQGIDVAGVEEAYPHDSRSPTCAATPLPNTYSIGSFKDIVSNRRCHPEPESPRGVIGSEPQSVHQQIRPEQIRPDLPRQARYGTT